ncbi:MAG: response regulator [Labilithrix sp.]|nr:response regulator [Labilithrix sp.]MCW5809854.1 response regulator [Labilithrix sp.]
MATSAPLVLVADDEPSMLELVARHLRTMSDPKLEVIQASDGEEAWRLAQEHLPDLVVLDVMMPGMSGWEVCRKIREDIALAHTGVVMLTGIGENLNQMTSPLYGADAYIDKPFEFEDFDDKVRDTLKSRESQRLGVVRPSINGTAGAAKPAPTSKGSKALAKEKPAKKAAAKKPAAKKPAPKKKPAAKKPAVKKAATKKPAAKKPAAKKKPAAAKKPAAKKKAAAKPAKKKAAKKR